MCNLVLCPILVNRAQLLSFTLHSNKKTVIVAILPLAYHQLALVSADTKIPSTEQIYYHYYYYYYYCN